MSYREIRPDVSFKFKAAYTTRRVPNSRMRLVLNSGKPRTGDLVLARVTAIGHHEALEHREGRRIKLFPGDEILVCYGNRYAPDQFEAYVPEDLGPCHLAAQGGLAATIHSWHASMRPPTALEPLGLVADGDGRPLNLRDFALPAPQPPLSRPHTIAVVGSSMNAGKTTTAANLIRGLSAAGLRVGAAKVTGTGAGKDLYFMEDAGAALALDFTDAGFASTYLTPVAEVESIVERLTGQLASVGVDTIVIEVADGLYQRETAALLTGPAFAAAVDDLLFAAGDAMGAAAGAAWLQASRLPLRAISGALTASPLAMLEAQSATNTPIVSVEDLRSTAVAELFGAPALAA